MIDDDDCGAVGGMRTGRGNRSIRRKPAPVPLCPPQIPHDLTWARTWTSAVGSRRLTAWAMARPFFTLKLGTKLFLFVCCMLFYDASNITSYIRIASNDGMIDELERIWKEVVLTWLKCYCNISPEAVKGTTRNLSQDNLCLARNSNRRPPDTPTLLVIFYQFFFVSST
jgi:hypothetical protein